MVRIDGSHLADQDGKVVKKKPKSVKSADLDLRPLCPYGKDCYRTNPKHLKEFRHEDTVRLIVCASLYVHSRPSA